MILSSCTGRLRCLVVGWVVDETEGKEERKQKGTGEEKEAINFFSSLWGSRVLIGRGWAATAPPAFTRPPPLRAVTLRLGGCFQGGGA